VKLGIGTAQFGMDYGVSNTQGITPAQEVSKILSYANLMNIHYIDTAPAYQQSECILGQQLPVSHKFCLISKCAGESYPASLTASLQRLQQEKIYGLLLHQVQEILSESGQEKFAELTQCKTLGLVEKIGVSVYTPQQVETVLANYPIDIIQVPINLFDQRLLNLDLLKRLKKQQIEIHARSIFLQGLLLMENSKVPAYFQPWVSMLKKYQEFLREQNCSPLVACLNFIKSLGLIDVAIVGVNNLLQLQQIHAAYQQVDQTDYFDYSAFAVNDEGLLDPTQWKVT
jgi:aryl-alcohol dehydrogenase-like predicted oxidoreductase